METLSPARDLPGVTQRSCRLPAPHIRFLTVINKEPRVSLCNLRNPQLQRFSSGVFHIYRPRLAYFLRANTHCVDSQRVECVSTLKAFRFLTLLKKWWKTFVTLSQVELKAARELPSPPAGADSNHMTSRLPPPPHVRAFPFSSFSDPLHVNLL